MPLSLRPTRSAYKKKPEGLPGHCWQGFLQVFFRFAGDIGFGPPPPDAKPGRFCICIGRNPVYSSSKAPVYS